MYFVISFNYRNSDVVLRSKLSQLKLEDFKDFKEVMYLQTCNRVEIIFDKKRDLNILYDKVFYKVVTPEEFLKTIFDELEIENVSLKEVTKNELIKKFQKFLLDFEKT